MASHVLVLGVSLGLVGCAGRAVDPGGDVGTNDCTVQVQGAPDTKLTWNSSCGGTLHTIDGVAENLVFICN